MKALLEARLRRGVRRQRRAARQRSRIPRPPRYRSHPHRHRLAGVDRLRPHRFDRRKGPDHRRRQYGHGLLPVVAPAGRQRHQGDGAPAARLLQSSPWELEDAEEEGVEILINHAPKRFVIENGKLTGMEFERLEWDAEAKNSKTIDTVFLPADDVILAIGQENAFPWIERDLGIEFDKWDMPVVNEKTMQSTRAGRLLRRRCGVGAEEHHLGRRARPSGGHLDPQLLPGCPGHRAAAAGHEPHQPEDGAQRVELSQRLQSGAAPEDAPRRSGRALRAVEYRSGAGLHRRTDRARSAALPELRHRDRLHRRNAASSATPASTSVRCSASPSREAAKRPIFGTRLSAPAVNLDQALYASAPLPQTGRIMVKDEDLCVHCGLCAERCPTAAWDMQKFELH